jgi:hypothetical protein
MEGSGPEVAAGSHRSVQRYPLGDPSGYQQELVGVWIEENAILGAQTDQKCQQDQPSHQRCLESNRLRGDWSGQESPQVRTFDNGRHTYPGRVVASC